MAGNRNNAASSGGSGSAADWASVMRDTRCGARRCGGGRPLHCIEAFVDRPRWIRLQWIYFVSAINAPSATLPTLPAECAAPATPLRSFRYAGNYHLSLLWKCYMATGGTSCPRWVRRARRRTNPRQENPAQAATGEGERSGGGSIVRVPSCASAPIDPKLPYSSRSYAALSSRRRRTRGTSAATMPRRSDLSLSS